MTRVRLFQRDSVTRKRTRSQSTGNKRWGLISPTNKILAVFHISLKLNVAPCNKFTLHLSLFWICSFVLCTVFWYGGPGRSSRYPILEWIPLPNGLELTRWRKPKDWKKWTFAFCILQRQLCSKKNGWRTVLQSYARLSPTPAGLKLFNQFQILWSSIRFSNKFQWTHRKAIISGKWGQIC